MIEERRLRHRLYVIDMEMRRIQRERASLDQQYALLVMTRIEVASELDRLEHEEGFSDKLDSESA